jgi:hypothetical protein
MKTSRTVFSEIQKKAGAFPFTLRSLDDEKRARMGVSEAVAHGKFIKENALTPGLLKAYDIVHTSSGTLVAEFFFTSEYTIARLELIVSRPPPRWAPPPVAPSHLVLCVSLDIFWPLPS